MRKRMHMHTQAQSFMQVQNTVPEAGAATVNTESYFL